MHSHSHRRTKVRSFVSFVPKLNPFQKKQAAGKPGQKQNQKVANYNDADLFCDDSYLSDIFAKDAIDAKANEGVFPNESEKINSNSDCDGLSDLTEGSKSSSSYEDSRSASEQFDVRKQYFGTIKREETSNTQVFTNPKISIKRHETISSETAIFEKKESTLQIGCSQPVQRINKISDGNTKDQHAIMEAQTKKENPSKAQELKKSLLSIISLEDKKDGALSEVNAELPIADWSLPEYDHSPLSEVQSPKDPAAKLTSKRKSPKTVTSSIARRWKTRALSPTRTRTSDAQTYTSSYISIEDLFYREPTDVDSASLLHVDGCDPEDNGLDKRVGPENEDNEHIMSFMTYSERITTAVAVNEAVSRERPSTFLSEMSSQSEASPGESQHEFVTMDHEADTGQPLNDPLLEQAVAEAESLAVESLAVVSPSVPTASASEHHDMSHIYEERDREPKAPTGLPIADWSLPEHDHSPLSEIQSPKDPAAKLTSKRKSPKTVASSIARRWKTRALSPTRTRTSDAQTCTSSYISIEDLFYREPTDVDSASFHNERVITGVPQSLFVESSGNTQGPNAADYSEEEDRWSYITYGERAKSTGSPEAIQPKQLRTDLVPTITRPKSSTLLSEDYNENSFSAIGRHVLSSHAVDDVIQANDTDMAHSTLPDSHVISISHENVIENFSEEIGVLPKKASSYDEDSSMTITQSHNLGLEIGQQTENEFQVLDKVDTYAQDSGYIDKVREDEFSLSYQVPPPALSLHKSKHTSYLKATDTYIGTEGNISSTEITEPLQRIAASATQVAVVDPHSNLSSPDAGKGKKTPRAKMHVKLQYNLPLKCIVQTAREAVAKMSPQGAPLVQDSHELFIGGEPPLDGPSDTGREDMDMDGKSIDLGMDTDEEDEYYARYLANL